jgi:hypothetical protein
MRHLILIVVFAALAMTAWAAELGCGLRAEYFEGREFETRLLARTDAAIDFLSPWAGLPRQENFCARWRGSVLPAFSDTYTFITTSDDGIRLWVNGQLLLENWTDHGDTEDRGTVKLEAGKKVEIKIEFFQGGGPCRLRLEWESEHQPRQVVPSTALFPPLFPEGRIAYHTSATPQKSGIVVIASTGETRTLSDPGGLWRPVLSADGSKLAYTSGAHVTAWSDPKVAKNTEVYLLDLRTPGAFPRRLTNAGLEDDYAAFTHDGKWVVFASRRDMTWDHYAASTATSKQKRLTETKSAEAAAACSPDGAWIVFETNRDGQWELYRRNLEDDVETRLTDKGGRNPAISPDGQWIVFAAARDGNPTQLFKMKPDGTEVTPLTKDAFVNDCPCFSPAGDTVLYQSTRNGKTDLYMFTLSTGTTTAFTTTGAAFGPTWSR